MYIGYLLKSGADIKYVDGEVVRNAYYMKFFGYTDAWICFCLRTMFPYDADVQAMTTEDVGRMKDYYQSQPNFRSASLPHTIAEQKAFNQQLFRAEMSTEELLVHTRLRFPERLSDLTRQLPWAEYPSATNAPNATNA